MNNRKTELRLQVAPGMAGLIPGSRQIRKLRRGKLQTCQVTTTYYDTPRLLLRNAGIGLAIHADGNHREQVVEAPVYGPAGLESSRTCTARVTSGPELAAIDDLDLQALLKRGGAFRRLTPVFQTTVTRTAVELVDGDTRMRLQVDEGLMSTLGSRGKRQVPLAEVELELLRGDVAPLLDLALELAESFDITLIHPTRMERGHALARPALQPTYAKAPLVPLDPAMSVREAFYRIMAGSLEHLFANEVQVAAGQPEAVHQARVALRRIRAALRAFKRVLPYDKRKAFNGELRWFQLQLAPARDWQVFLEETLPNIELAAPGRVEVLGKLRKLAQVERRRAIAESADIFRSRRYTRLLLQFERWLAKPDEVLRAGTHKQPVREFAASVLAKTRRDFLADTRPLFRMAAEDLHGLRKRGKKARYAAEFFASLWTPRESQPFISLSQYIQDALGKSNDASAARLLLSQLNPERVDAEMWWLVRDWSAQQAQACASSAQPRWRRLQKMAPFWA